MGVIKAGPKKKLLQVDDEDNPYLRKRKPRKKTALWVAIGALVVCGVATGVMIHHSKQTMAEAQRKADEAKVKEEQTLKQLRNLAQPPTKGLENNT